MRLRRPMCGRSVTFRKASHSSLGLRPSFSNKPGHSPKDSLRPGARSETFRTSGGEAARATVASHIERIATTVHNAFMKSRYLFVGVATLMTGLAIGAVGWTTHSHNAT